MPADTAEWASFGCPQGKLGLQLPSLQWSQKERRQNG
jgi:hypothetical protein